MKIVDSVENINWMEELNGMSLHSAIQYLKDLQDKNHQWITAYLDIYDVYDDGGSLYEARIKITRYETAIELKDRLEKEEIKRVAQLGKAARKKAAAERKILKEVKNKEKKEIEELALFKLLKDKYEG